MARDDVPKETRPVRKTLIASLALATLLGSAGWFWLQAATRVPQDPQLDPTIRTLVAECFVGPKPPGVPPPPPLHGEVIDEPLQIYCPADENEATLRIDVTITMPDGHHLTDMLHAKRCPPCDVGKLCDITTYPSMCADSMDPRSWFDKTSSLDDTTETHGTYTMSATWKNVDEPERSYEVEARIQLAPEYVARLRDGGEIRVRTTHLDRRQLP